MNLGCVADFNRVCELITDVDQELKYLDRILLKLKAISFDDIGMMDMQEELHEHYAEKTRSIGVNI